MEIHACDARGPGDCSVLHDGVRKRELRTLARRKLKNFVERTLAIAFEIKRDVLESKRFKDGGEPLRHFDREGPRQFVGSDLDPHHFTVKADTELPKTERLDLFLAGFDGMDILDRDGRAVWDARTQASRRGAVPRGKAGGMGEFADFGFAKSGIGERGGDAVLLGGVLARAIIAEIVEVDPVDNVFDRSIAAKLFEAGEEFVFAVETAVGVIADVIGIIEFVGDDELMGDAELRGEGFRVALMGTRKRRGIGSDGKSVLAERPVGGPGEVGGIGAA